MHVPCDACVPCSENVVFIFLVHPFDVGDTLLLNSRRHDVSPPRQPANPPAFTTCPVAATAATLLLSLLF